MVLFLLHWNPLLSGQWPILAYHEEQHNALLDIFSVHFAVCYALIAMINSEISPGHCHFMLFVQQNDNIYDNCKLGLHNIVSPCITCQYLTIFTSKLAQYQDCNPATVLILMFCDVLQ